jgi:hypothetical protein
VNAFFKACDHEYSILHAGFIQENAEFAEQSRIIREREIMETAENQDSKPAAKIKKRKRKQESEEKRNNFLVIHSFIHKMIKLIVHSALWKQKWIPR